MFKISLLVNKASSSVNVNASAGGVVTDTFKSTHVARDNTSTKIAVTVTASFSPLANAVSIQFSVS